MASFSLLAALFLGISLLLATATPSRASFISFVYLGCSQLKFSPNSPYESNLNSLLASLVNSAQYSLYNHFTSNLAGAGASSSVSGLFQCRGDLPGTACSLCVSRAVTELGRRCSWSTGGVIQLDGCFLKYDDVSFVGVQDKAVVAKKCGSAELDSDASNRLDSVMGYLAGQESQTFRAGGSGEVHGVAQCVGDLSLSACQDCLVEAIGRLRGECGTASWGDMFLGKCYVRYSGGGVHSRAGLGKMKACLLVWWLLIITFIKII